jgi:transcriptional regulator with XRE-family HTH domain
MATMAAKRFPAGTSKGGQFKSGGVPVRSHVLFREWFNEAVRLGGPVLPDLRPRLLKARGRLGVSVRELSGLLGVPHHVISHVENGRKPRAGTYRAVLAAFVESSEASAGAARIDKDYLVQLWRQRNGATGDTTALGYYEGRFDECVASLGFDAFGIVEAKEEAERLGPLTEEDAR